MLLIWLTHRYYGLADVDAFCQNNSVVLIADIKGCKKLKLVKDKFESKGLNVETLGGYQQENSFFRAKLYREELHIKEYELNREKGKLIMRFTNGYLSSILFYPESEAYYFIKNPQYSNKMVSFEHHIDINNFKYGLWKVNTLEKYVSTWVSKFS